MKYLLTIILLQNVLVTQKEQKMVYNVPTIQMVIVDAGEVLLDFSVTNVIVVTMAQLQEVDVKVREFSTNQDKGQFNFSTASL